MILMRGLPFDISRDSIVAFFAGYGILPDSVIIGEKSDGKRSGEGAILFTTEHEATRAEVDKDNKNIGHRYIELFKHPYKHY